MMTTPNTRFGFVAIVGAPNAGKSTLVNRIVGGKVTIVSPKVQTTRNRVMGIAIHEQSQIVLVDTPGIFFKPKSRLEKAMVHAAWSSLDDADRVVYVLDAASPRAEENLEILERILEKCRAVILVINKIDKVPKEKLLVLAEAFARPSVSEVFMICASKGHGVPDLLKSLSAAVPEGAWMFPEDQMSTLPERLLSAEITREQVFLKLHDELPYAINVVVDAWEEFDNGSVKITQTIIVERDSQKAIVLGKGGAQIKSIGMAARQVLSHEMERDVHLSIHVKVNPRWQESHETYQTMGLDFGV